MNKLLIVFITASYFLVACQKVNIQKSVPLCIEEKIERNKDCIQKVEKYDYDGETVYLFKIDVACEAVDDFDEILYDEKCHCICRPSGGISGNGDGKCQNFHQEARWKEEIWHKKN